jgi:hypothetical protein
VLAPIQARINRNNDRRDTAVAAVSRRLLDAGARVCLYTDQANPTSNGIYKTSWYRPVVDQVNLRIADARRYIGASAIFR